MAKRVSVDGWLFTVTLFLIFVGLVMVFSASAVMAKERYGSAYVFLFKQLGWAAAGLLLMVLGMKIDYRRYKHPAVVFSLLGVTTLMLISVFFLDRAHHTHRWMHWGPLSFQPSEMAKPALILFLAFFLADRTKAITDWRNTILPAVVPTLIFIGLIVAQPDLGTAIACAAITGCVLFVAGMEMRYLGYGFLASLLPLYFLIFHVAWRRDRILAFLNPYSDPQGRGFHIIQSIIAVTAEELGLVGSLVIVMLFAVFLWRGTRTALRTQDMFGRLLAMGITSMIVVQAFINISVVLGLMPTKGIPLPFVSYGGSSLLFALASVGVLLDISKQAE